MWYNKDLNKDSNKVLYVARGLSGSGKSTLAKKLAGDTGAIFSADDFFMNNGKYEFSTTKLGDAHQWNYKRATDAIRSGISPIVIDNTNVEAWEPKRYVEFALSNGYRIEIAEPDTPWKFNAQELYKRNTHGVPLETIQKKLDSWQPDITVEDILNADAPWEKKKKQKEEDITND